MCYQYNTTCCWLYSEMWMPMVVARIRKIRKQSNKIKGVIKFDEKFYVQHQRETNWENFEIQGALNERKYNKLTHERTHEHTNTCRYQHTWKIYILFYREQQQQRKLFRSEKEIIVPVRTYTKYWKRGEENISICFIYLYNVSFLNIGFEREIVNWKKLRGNALMHYVDVDEPTILSEFSKVHLF